MSTISKERVKDILEFGSGRIISPITDDEIMELARIALASLEAEPAIHRWRRVTSEPYGPYPWHYGDFIGFSKPVDGIEDEYFYTAPPAPANAEPVAWLWSHRKHPSEVSLIRPEDDERAEGAHWSGWSCQALYAAPPAPVSVPDDVMAAMQKVARIRLDLNDFDGDKRGILDCLGDAEEALIEVVNHRAAMLQGAEPVTPDYKLPANTPCKDAPEHIWLQTAGVWPENGEFSELTWCSDNQHKDDTLYVRADVVTGNSPAIPDGWVACSERMPEEGEIVLTSDGTSVNVGESERSGVNLRFFTSIFSGRELPATHWMPLPAAPQQEVKP